MKRLLSVAAVATGIALSSSLAPAHAYSLTGSPACELGSITGYTSCSGSYSLSGGENDVTDGGADNIVTQLLNDDDLFGASTADWDFGAKFDGGWQGDNEAGLSLTGLGSTSGTFDFSNIDLATTDIAVSLKAAKGFSVYYIEAGTLTDPSQIAWSTAGTSTNRRGVAQGLSHFSYYTRISEPPTPRIRKTPEPTALSGLLAIGVLPFLKRKKRKDS